MDFALNYQKIDALKKRVGTLSKHLSIDEKINRVGAINQELTNPEVWADSQKTQSLSREKSRLENILDQFQKTEKTLNDAAELMKIAEAEDDKETTDELLAELTSVERDIHALEVAQMFGGRMDKNAAYLDIQSGSGGTEAQDWAEMLLRMYLRFGERHGFKPKLMAVSPGEVAGIKSATIHFGGEYAFGWLRSEIGIHRLVRKSPFNASGKRHTSFSSVFVSPEVDADIQIQINPADLRIDTYRASGAGGQHVNKTDSAVRITHIPSATIVQCQDGRSQHANKEQAMRQLKSKLYELEVQKRDAEKQKMEDAKSDIGWGNQIRSYVLDQSRVKDLRTGVENSDTQAVLDGDLDEFIEASLRAGL